jgi:uncharacterized protein (DUF2147 family)
MNTPLQHVMGFLAFGLTAASPVIGASSPFGVWIDHTGRGAVEITDCGGKLCGRLVWFKDTKHSKDGCNFQVIGNVRSVGANKWDGGWIIDPDKDPKKKYDVEITLLSDTKLKVMGYAGMKFLSETMTWTRAPSDLKPCNETAADVVAPDKNSAPAPNDEPAATKSTSGATKNKPATSETSCKRYIAQIGQVVDVPCDRK